MGAPPWNLPMPDAKQLAEPKYRPLLITVGIAAVGITAVATICICGGVASWLFPASPPVVVHQPNPGMEVANETLTVEQFDAMADDATRNRDVAAVAKALEGHADLPSLRPSQLEFDQVGRITLPMTVVQVLDQNNALVRIDNIPGHARAVPGTPLTFWLTAIPTATLVDDTRFKMDGAFVVAGKRQYETASGSGRTVYLFRWVEPAVIEEARKSLVYPPIKGSP